MTAHANADDADDDNSTWAPSIKSKTSHACVLIVYVTVIWTVRCGVIANSMCADATLMSNHSIQINIDQNVGRRQFASVFVMFAFN